MSVEFKNVIEEAKNLNAQERGLVAHCLISSLETTHDEGVDIKWAELAEKRYNDLVSKKVNPVTWEQIKKEVKR